jgi:hypothetical protein
VSKPKLVEQWYLIQAISRDPKMARVDVAVAMELLDRMDDEGVAWSVYERLEKITQQSSRSVERSIHRLVVKPGGYFERVKKAGRESSPRFRPILPAAAAAAAAAAAKSPPDMAAFSESPPSLTEKPAISVVKRPPYLAGDFLKGIPIEEEGASHPTCARDADDVEFQGRPATDRQIAEEMIEIWTEELGGEIIAAVTPTGQRLRDWAGYWRELGKDPAGGFRAFCRTIRGSDFLMGGGEKGWRATMNWALKPLNRDKILSDDYGHSAASHARAVDILGRAARDFDGDAQWGQAA